LGIIIPRSPDDFRRFAQVRRKYWDDSKSATSGCACERYFLSVLIISAPHGGLPITAWKPGFLAEKI